MHNIHLSSYTAEDIDRQVNKVLRGLGNPEPPLDLASARDLLRLDKRFYSSTDSSWLGESVSRLKIAGKQVLLRPSLLLKAVVDFELKALYLPDQKRILLNQDVPDKKQRWNEAHEIAHSILPWHNDVTLGDDVHTPAETFYNRYDALTLGMYVRPRSESVVVGGGKLSA